MRNNQTKGIVAALASAFFLGLTPVFGKQAILLGFSPLAVVALRTAMAAGLLLLIMAIFHRPFFYIYPLGLVGCILAGTINGIGSLLFYLALGRLSASVGQLLYSLYPVFVALWLMLDRQPPSRLTLFRLGLAVLAVFLLTNPPGGERVDLTGTLLMLGAAALYALHLPVNQRVLYEVPAPTVTLYTLIAMSAVVVPAYYLFDHQWPTGNAPWSPVLALTLVTFLSRLMLFMGVKHLGGMQTALLGLGELLVTIVVSHIWLHERLTLLQWLGAIALMTSLLLVSNEHPPSRRNPPRGGILGWLRPPRVTPHLPWD